MTPYVQQRRVAALDPLPFALPPEDVLEGEPRPRYLAISRSQDGAVESGLFRCAPGRFRFTQVRDETTVVLKGTVTVTADDGSRVDCGVGDIMHLRRGTRLTFTVHEDYEDFSMMPTQEALDLLVPAERHSEGNAR